MSIWSQVSEGFRSRGARLVQAAVKVARDPDVLIATAIVLASTLLLAVTATQGFVRDEGYYFRAAADYHRWFEGLWHNLWAGKTLESLSEPTLTKAFGYNTEHPGFVKIFMGWSWKVFHGWLGWTSHATGYRLASIIMVGVGNGFLYLFGTRAMSRPVGALAVLLLMACPHVFYHAHLACFDGPIMAMTIVVAYAFWRSLESKWWILGAGLAWGVAVATKHNAVFLLPTLGLAWALARITDFRLTSDRGLAFPPIPWAFFVMAVAGPVIFLLFYPYGWHDPFGRIAGYYSYHLTHEHYPVDYFGTLFTEPPFPWSFPFVMSALTVPLMVWVPGVVGFGIWLFRAIDASLRSWRKRAPSAHPPIIAWLLVVCTIIPPLIIAVPTVPIFGGTKHWMPMMPFLCLLAAWVIVRAIAQTADWMPRFKRATAGIAVATVVAVPVYETARTHPLGHTYFNELAMGHQGGAALGMPRTFWGGDARQLLPTLDQQAGKGASVFTDRMNYDDFRAYQRDRLLRTDLRWVSDVRKADWALINHQREYQDNEYAIWALTGDRRPTSVLSFDGVPIASLYRVRARAGDGKAAIVVLDGYGLAPDGPGNAVTQALAKSPDGLLARALVKKELPWISLDASGTCVGLPEGMMGNSEAGHGNLCAGEVVEQSRLALDRLVNDPTSAGRLLTRVSRLAKEGRPLHVVVYLASRSSVGHYEHVLIALRMAKHAGLGDVQVHALCDGRPKGGCGAIISELERHFNALGVGRIATIAGRKHCFSRSGPEGVRPCVDAMQRPRSGHERSLAAIVNSAPIENDRQSHLQPEPVTGSSALGADDEVWVLPYRRDVVRPLIRVLRGRANETDPPSPAGPNVVTLGSVDSEDRYADDPHLDLGLDQPRRGGLLHQRLAAARVRQLRVAEQGKAAQVTFFCDGKDIPESETYQRQHPESIHEGYADRPCLSTVETVQAAIEAVSRGSADFILMNLSNADILGHTSDVPTTVEGILCMERALESFVTEATSRGFAVFVTADHGNAEHMLDGERLTRKHTANPVPFIAIAPRGKPPFALRQVSSPPCLGTVTWTALDAMGSEVPRGQSLLVRDR